MITDRKPLLYYPPVYPRVNTELNVVVCHINSPGDFYVQAVSKQFHVLWMFLKKMSILIKFCSIKVLFGAFPFYLSICLKIKIPPSHQVDSMESLLLTTRLQDCYNTPAVLEDEELKVYCPEIGQPCVARFEENLWYRAQVIGEDVFV